VWPFASDSPWNLPLGKAAAFSKRTDPTTQLLTADDATVWMNSEEYSIPVVRASEDDPSVAVVARTSETAPTQPFTTIDVKLPQGVRPARGTDGHLLVISPDADHVDEFYQFERSTGGATATYHVRTDLRGTGVGEGGVRAYGGSALGGLVRDSELLDGSIPHALALALTNDQLGPGPVWPATNEDTGGAEQYAGAIPMGTLVAIPPRVDITDLGLTPSGEAVARALQRYGAYVVDRSEGVTFYAEPSANRTALQEIRRDLPVIRRKLRIVTDSTEATPGGGGRPVTKLAPDLDLG
jgi:hypothetical protein